MVTLISSEVADFSTCTTRSMTDTSRVGTWNVRPLYQAKVMNEKTGQRRGSYISFSLGEGMTLPTALEPPVDDGMMLALTPRPPRQSLCNGPSTVF
jgi:hypothetical protein